MQIAAEERSITLLAWETGTDSLGGPTLSSLRQIVVFCCPGLSLVADPAVRPWEFDSAATTNPHVASAVKTCQALRTH